MDFCTASAALKSFLFTLTTGARTFDYQALIDNVVARNTSLATVLAVGSALLCAPVLLGPGWLFRFLWLLAAFAGAVASALFLESNAGAAFFNSLIALVKVGEQGACAIAIVLIVLTAVGLGGTAVGYVHLALFLAGAFSAGYGASFAYELAAPLVSEQVTVDLDDPMYLFGFIGIVALVGGFVLPKMATALLNGGLSILGAVLVAQALLQLVVVNQLLDASVASAIGFDTYFAFYSAGLAFACYCLRNALVGKPESAASPSKSNKRSKADDGLIMR